MPFEAPVNWFLRSAFLRRDSVTPTGITDGWGGPVFHIVVYALEEASCV